MNISQKFYAQFGSRARMLQHAIHDLWRNHPEYPSTFGRCANVPCEGSGRGSGLCKSCVLTAIEEITGDPAAAQELGISIEAVRNITHRLREMVGE